MARRGGGDPWRRGLHRGGRGRSGRDSDAGIATGRQSGATLTRCVPAPPATRALPARDARGRRCGARPGACSRRNPIGEMGMQRAEGGGPPTRLQVPVAVPPLLSVDRRTARAKGPSACNDVAWPSAPRCSAHLPRPARHRGMAGARLAIRVLRLRRTLRSLLPHFPRRRYRRRRVGSPEDPCPTGGRMDGNRTQRICCGLAARKRIGGRPRRRSSARSAR